jgi:hypothetical protein
VKEIFLKVSTIRARILKKFYQPCHRPKNFKEYWFLVAPNYKPAREAKLLTWPGQPLVSGWLCSVYEGLFKNFKQLHHGTHKYKST